MSNRQALPYFLLVLFSIVLAGGGDRASAGPACYDKLGCTDREILSVRELFRLGCQPLADIRNQIYKEKGVEGMLPPESYESKNAALIREIERLKGCRA
jgi:hypothetical protein